MGVRFDGSTDPYTASTTVGTGNATILCWGRVAVDRNAHSTFLSIDNGLDSGSGGRIIALQTGADGTTSQSWFFTSTDDTLIGPALTVGTWYRVAGVKSGTTGTWYIGTHTGALTTASTTLNGGTYNFTTVRVGASADGEWLNGETANVKVYAAALTQAEIELEWSQYTPVRTANLLNWYPLLAAGTADYSGNANTLSSAGTPTTDAEGPPIPWEVHPVGVILPPGAASTTVSAENAAGTGQANDAPGKVTAMAGDAASTGAANDSTVTVTDAPRPLFRGVAVSRAANY